MSLIESIIKRNGGTKVELGGVQYHFKPQATGAHVASVEDEAHARRFLAIREGFRRYEGELTEEDTGPAKVEPPKVAGILYGSSVHPATFEIGGKTVSLGEVVAAAFDNQAAQNGMTSAEWNALTDDERHDLIDQELDLMAEQAGGESEGEATDPSQSEPQGKPMTERQELALQYKAKFGKNPPHAMKTENILAKLQEA